MSPPSPSGAGVPQGVSASRRDWTLGVGALLLVAALRALTLAPDPWEWDEVLFLNAVERGIDLRVSQPHPPGYPAFIEAGRLLSAAGLPSFDALTLTGAAGGIASVVGIVFLGSRLGLSTPYSLLAGLLYAFIPSVWLHGVRPLTEPPATAAFVFAAGFLVDAVRTRRGACLVAGAAGIALATGFRPQAGLALVPFATWAAVRVLSVPRGGRAVLLSAAIAAGLTVLIWRLAVEGSGGFGAFRERLREQARYVDEVDRAKLSDLPRSLFWKRWWRDPFGHSGLAYTLLTVAGAAFVLRRRPAAALLGVFLPVVVLSVLFGSRQVAPRYALVFLPAPCLLAALTLERISGSARLLAAGGGVALVASLAAVAVPPVVEVHARPSPSVAAMTTLRDDASLRGRPIWYDGHLGVHVPRYLPGRTAALLPDGESNLLPAGSLVVATDANFRELSNAVRTFRFDSTTLHRISRARYLSVRICETANVASR